MAWIEWKRWLAFRSINPILTAAGDALQRPARRRPRQHCTQRRPPKRRIAPELKRGSAHKSIADQGLVVPQSHPDAIIACHPRRTDAAANCSNDLRRANSVNGERVPEQHVSGRGVQGCVKPTWCSRILYSIASRGAQAFRRYFVRLLLFFTSPNRLHGRVRKSTVKSRLIAEAREARKRFLAPDKPGVVEPSRSGQGTDHSPLPVRSKCRSIAVRST